MERMVRIPSKGVRREIYCPTCNQICVHEIKNNYFGTNKKHEDIVYFFKRCTYCFEQSKFKNEEGDELDFKRDSLPIKEWNALMLLHT